MIHTIQHDGDPVDIEISHCNLHMDGEFAGNFDLLVSTKPAQATFWWDGQRIGQVPVKQIHEADYDDSERFEHPPKQGCGTAVLLLGAGLLVPLASRLLDWTP